MTDNELRALVRQAAITVAAAIIQTSHELTQAVNESDVTDPMPAEDATDWAAALWDAAEGEPPAST